MPGFKVIKLDKAEPKQELWNDRQNRIQGWDAEAIRNARILVVGAGAIANEVIKNLALLGFGYAYIADMDRIDITNLTRTVLFTKAEVGEIKSVVAAKKFREMNLEETSSADSFVGDIVYELGDGIFHRVDIVLGCLDNMETRFAVNRICMRYGIPYIDGAIGDLNTVCRVINGHEYGCLECYAGKTLKDDRIRQSCALTMKKQVTEGKIATVQTTSAFVAAQMVQEAIKIICSMGTDYGMEYFYFGLNNSFIRSQIKKDPCCLAHAINLRTNVTETPLTNGNTLRQVLEYAQTLGFDTISVKDDKLRGYITESVCPCCGEKVDVNLPFFKYFADDYVCDNCKNNGTVYFKIKVTEDDMELYNEYSFSSCPEAVLDRTLEELGIPAFHVLKVIDGKTGECGYIELTGDFGKVAPEYFKKTAKDTE